MDRTSIARRIEATVLRPAASRRELDEALADAHARGCGYFCLLPARVADLRGAPLPLVTVAGFPHGLDRSDVKADAAARALQDGAAEIDMVVQLGAIRDGDWPRVAADVACVRRATAGAVLKVILETGLLEPAEVDHAARVCREEGADFLKTSTGTGPRGATAADVRALARHGPVKAAGGIRDRAQAEELVAAGADRIGTSAWAAILVDGGAR